MRIFLIVFSVLSIAIFAFHFQAKVYAATTAPWTEMLAAISTAIITFFDSTVIAQGAQILTDPATNSQNFSGVHIVAGCNGVEAWLVLVAAIMAFPPYSTIKFRWIALGLAIILLFPWQWDAWFWKLLIALLFLFVTQLFSPIGKQKLIGVSLGFVAIQVLNVGRVISLFYLGKWDKDLFDFAHYYLWQALIILDAFVVFLIWLSKLPDSGDSDDDDGDDGEGEYAEAIEAATGEAS